MSSRSLFMMQEIRKIGLSLGMKPEEVEEKKCDEEEKWWVCDIEYPLTEELVKQKGDEAYADVNRLKLIHVHVHVIKGPYKDGTFVMEIDLRETPNYPFEPPKCRYLTKMWHPNVHEETGKICHSHLRCVGDPRPGTWSPTLRLHTLITGIIGHFNPEDNAFEPMDPLNPIAASQFLDNNDAFLAKVKEWTRKHAEYKLINPVNNCIQ